MAEKKKTKRTKAARRPARRKPKKKQTGRSGTLRVKQTRSGLGHAEAYRRTLRALGLKHYQDEVVVADTPSLRGMLFKVRHLVNYSEE